MSKKAVGLYGYFGHGNLGDEAIREAWQRSLRSRWHVNTASPPRLPREKGPWLFVGGLFQDRTSRRSLLLYALALAVAREKGPVGLAAVGADIRSRISQRVLRTLLPRVDFASARDESSLAQLRALGARVRLGRDPVLSWPSPPRTGGGPLLVNLIPGLPASVRKGVLEGAHSLGKRLHRPVLGLAMDREDARALRTIPCLHPATPEEAVATIASASMVIGSRLHALELSLVAGTSFLAVPYAPKVEHFLTLVDWELPAPVPRHPWGPDEVELVLAPEWVRGLLRARERLREEAEKGIRDVLNWLKQVA